MLVWDIETNGLLEKLTKIHVLRVIDRETGERLRFTDHPELGAPEEGFRHAGTIADGLRLLQDAPVIGGHGIIAFDIPAAKKLYPWFNPKGIVKDSLTYSRVIWTDLREIDFRAVRRRRRPPEFEERRLVGHHSLEAWGFRLSRRKDDYKRNMEARAAELGLPKEEWEEFVWGTFNPDMDFYCGEDCEVNLQLFEKIEDEGYSDEALELELRVAEIIDLQEKHGVLFDVAAAEQLAGALTAEMAEIDAKLREAFKPWYAPVVVKGKIVEKTPTRKVWLRGATTDGEAVKFSVDAGWSHCPVKLVEFEPSSRDKIASRLKTLFDWEPQEFTDTGKPKVDETTLEGLDYPEARLLKDYLTLAKRLGFLATGKKALLKQVGPDGRVHGRVNSNGAVTGRMTHFEPNLAQVPKVKLDKDDKPLMGLAGGYGHEMRSLFVAPKGKVLVGVDAEGLELRMLAHYMARYDGGAYVETVVNGNKKAGTDVHTVNRNLVGLNSRDNAKTWKYAYLYGAGNWKLGVTEYEDMSDNRRAEFNARFEPGKARTDALSRLGANGRRKIETGLPALGRLQSEVQKRAKRGFLRGLDGRKLRVRGMHSALNTLLQGGGAIVMKKALVLAYDALLELGWRFGREFALVLSIHDEYQWEVDEDKAEILGRVVVDAIRRAGGHFNLRTPLAGSMDIGANWGSTH